MRQRGKYHVGGLLGEPWASLMFASSTAARPAVNAHTECLCVCFFFPSLPMAAAIHSAEEEKEGLWPDSSQGCFGTRIPARPSAEKRYDKPWSIAVTRYAYLTV